MPKEEGAVRAEGFRPTPSRGRTSSKRTPGTVRLPRCRGVYVSWFNFPNGNDTSAVRFMSIHQLEGNWFIANHDDVRKEDNKGFSLAHERPRTTKWHGQAPRVSPV